MASGDQQFCLRWNNHQTSLTSIFSTLYDAGQLVDCSVAAEGEQVKVHRVLLSACSPYFQHLLTENQEKHPIIILRDVPFRLLDALVTYMYRGEVNVSQDDLSELLKVAESLKIKGLSDSAEKTDDRLPQHVSAPPQPAQLPAVPRSIERSSNYQSNDLHGDQLSTPAELPGPRKRKRVRRPSDEGQSQAANETLTSPISDSSLVIQPSKRLQVTSTASSKTNAVIPEIESTLERACVSDPATNPVVVPKTELPIEQVLVPKQEIDDLADESNYEDLTLDDDDDDNMMDNSQPGPSQGSDGSSSQGYPPWQMSTGTDGTVNDSGMQLQDQTGGTRDTQDVPGNGAEANFVNINNVQCSGCGKSYLKEGFLIRHITSGCPALVKASQCNICKKTWKDKRLFQRHLLTHCWKNV